MRRTAYFLLVVLVLIGCTGSSADSTLPATVTSSTVPAVGLVAPVVRHPISGEVIYFVLTDRFENGDPSNDYGGVDPEAGPMGHGFLPTNPGYFHGGDLAGLTARLDYLEGLGVTAIWITPPFVNNATQGDGTVGGSSAGYHGYWQVDFTTIDPHLGTERDMVDFVEAAHDRGIRVILDVVTNHTGDIIRHKERTTPYRWKQTDPYLDADGNPFDPAAIPAGGAFPALDPEVSFPYSPVFASEEDAAIKAPAWLNDPTVYHNRGSHEERPEALSYGDLNGLDDLFTEHPRVVEGMIDIYAEAIARYGIDGIRVDTVRHVNDEFWEAWIPAIQAAAADAGKNDFFLFGEVFGANPGHNSRFTTQLPFPGLLDFGFNDAVFRFVVGDSPSRVLASHFDNDDLFTDADSNASMLVKFVGNHDIGRLGYALRLEHPRATDAELVARAKLAFGLLFLTRGVPVVFYGDEQGFVGDGGDRGARQDMFSTLVAAHSDDDLIGTDATLANANFDIDHPLYRTVSEMAALRAEHPALSAGAQVERYSNAKAGVYAASRIDREERVEYLIAFNNTGDDKAVTFDTFSPFTWFEGIMGTDERVRTLASGAIRLTVPGFSTLVLRAGSPIPATPAPELTIVTPGGVANPRVKFEVAPASSGLFEVTFAVSVDGAPFAAIGTDDSPPYRVNWLPPTEFSTVKIMATLDDLVGGRSVAEWEVGR